MLEKKREKVVNLRDKRSWVFEFVKTEVFQNTHVSEFE